MAENTKIEWADATFNPWIGCTKVSDGCKNCYAEALMDKRMGKAQWGDNGTRVRTSEDYWKKPLKWNREAEAKGTRYRVFCASLADVYEDRKELAPLRKDLWYLIMATPNLDWLILTKRPENILRFTPGLGRVPNSGVPPNIWFGTSVENQEQADKRIPELLQVPAAVRFLSCEPLLGPVDLGFWICADGICKDCGHPDDLHGDCRIVGCQAGDGSEENPICGCRKIRGESFHRIGMPYKRHSLDWVIAGGESGPGARPMHPEWVRSLRDQCKAAEVPFLFKQQGEWGATAFKFETGEDVFRTFETRQQWINKASLWMNKGDICLDPDGKVLATGADFNTCRYPVTILRRVGKHAAGRLLDGVEHNEFPGVQNA